jgi:hypothetical protein
MSTTSGENTESGSDNKGQSNLQTGKERSGSTSQDGNQGRNQEWSSQRPNQGQGSTKGQGGSGQRETQGRGSENSNYERWVEQKRQQRKEERGAVSLLQPQRRKTRPGKRQNAGARLTAITNISHFVFSKTKNLFYSLR